MNRPPVMPALAFLSVLSLSLAPAHAAVELIPQGTPTTTTSTETRIVATSETAEFPGTKQLISTTPATEETITGPTTKLVKQVENRTYSVPMTTYFLNREESRQVSVTQQNYIRRTTQQVIDTSWKTYIFGGPTFAGVDIRSRPFDVYDVEEIKKDSWIWGKGVYMPPGPTEYDANYWNQANCVIVAVSPSGWGSSHLQAWLWFDKSLQFLGGYFNDGHGATRIRKAWVTQNWDNDFIHYDLDCTLNDDWWRIQPACGTKGRFSYKLKGKLVFEKSHATYRTVTKDEPAVETTTAYGPWTPTGVVTKGFVKMAGWFQPMVRTETTTEKVVLSQRTAVNSTNATKGLATTGQSGRRAFTGDTSSEARSASLSGSKVRQALKANQAKASQVTSQSHGAGAPQPPATPPAQKPETSGTGLGALLGAGATANTAGLSTGTKPDAGTSSATGLSQDSWWFPKDPQAPPPRLRFEAYRTRR